MKNLLFLLFVFLLSTSQTFAQPSPCGSIAQMDPGVVYVGQDCRLGEWYVKADYGYASGTIVASAPMKVTEKFAADGLWNGKLISQDQGKVIRFALDNLDVMTTGFKFTAELGTNVAIIPDYGEGYFSVGGSAPDFYKIVNLTDPSIPHLFMVIPRAGQQLLKGEDKVLRWISSPDFDRVSIAIGRSPSSTSWIRSPDGSYAFNIDNNGEYLWDVLRINSACHDFYLKLSGYKNDNSGQYLLTTSEVFNVLHDKDYGFTCPPITK